VCWGLVCTQNGFTPLYIAAQNGHKDVAEMLLAHGAQVDQANEVSSLQNTSTHAHTNTYGHTCGHTVCCVYCMIGHLSHTLNGVRVGPYPHKRKSRLTLNRSVYRLICLFVQLCCIILSDYDNLVEADELIMTV
jgi:hypothetical protein